jgi:Flp pilus assembly pilin Flp
MVNFFKNFSKDESGAVTVDWVVLTAAVVGLGVAAYSSISGGATTLTANTVAAMTGASATPDAPAEPEAPAE